LAPAALEEKDMDGGADKAGSILLDVPTAFVFQKLSEGPEQSLGGGALAGKDAP